MQKAITSDACIDILEIHGPLWPKYLTENVVAVLEAALDCFKEFISMCEPDFLSQIQVSILKPLIEKCLGHTNEGIRNKSLNYTLLFFNISENFEEETMKTISSYLGSKV